MEERSRSERLEDETERLEEQAEDVERDLERHGNKLERDIERTRADWKHKEEDRSVPGAVPPEPDDE